MFGDPCFERCTECPPGRAARDRPEVPLEEAVPPSPGCRSFRPCRKSSLPARRSIVPLAMWLMGGDWVSSPIARLIPRARSTPVRGELELAERAADPSVFQHAEEPVSQNEGNTTFEQCFLSRSRRLWRVLEPDKSSQIRLRAAPRCISSRHTSRRLVRVWVRAAIPIPPARSMGVRRS
jgi:hypothetical protein